MSRRSARELVLTAGAALGALCLVLGAALWVSDARLLVVRSDSMSPAISAGDLLITRSVPAAELRPGEVISVVDSAGTRVSHRIEASEGTGHRRTVTLRGDANAVADPQPYVLSRADRVAVNVPRAGHLVAAAVSPAGRALMVGLVIGCWAMVLVPGRAGRGAAASGVALLMVATAAVALPAGRAWAVFSDSGTLQTATFAAHRLVAQAQPTCTDVGFITGSARLTWRHVDARYVYRWQAVRASDGQEVGSGVVMPTVAVGQNVSLDIGPTLLNLNLTGVNIDVTLRAELRGTGGWQASTATTSRIHTAGLLVELRVRCGSS